jgi:hypothetical protein
LFHLKGGIYFYVQECVSPIDANQIAARHREGYMIICEVFTIVKYLQADMHDFSMQKVRKLQDNQQVFLKKSPPDT